MALPSISDLKMWVGTLFTKDDWDFNFSQIVDWLASGTSDLVVNSIKSENGIDLDGSTISNLAPAETGSQAVNLDQAQTLLNRSSHYYPFSVASGKVDGNGNAAFLEITADSIKVLAGNVNPDLVCVQSDGTIESVTTDTLLTKPSAVGVYHIIKEKEQPISITAGTANKVTIGKVQPTSDLTVGDYFLNNSVVPFVGKKYTSEGWEVIPFCYLGDVTVTADDVTVTPSNYNNNDYDVNLVESYYGDDGWYRIYADGCCEQGGKKERTANATAVDLMVDYADTNYTILIQEYHNGTTGATSGNVSPCILTDSTLMDGSKFTYWMPGSSLHEGAYWYTRGKIKGV